MQDKYSSQTSFLDLLLILVCLFVLLFSLAFLKVNEDKSEKNTETKTEFRVTAEWPTQRTDDVDLWIEAFNTYLCGYKQKENGPLFLHRDDLGRVNDIIPTPDGDVEYSENIEHIDIKKGIDGWYVINLHLYRADFNRELPVEVLVKVEKLNPYSVVFAKKIKLDRNWQEKTVVRLKIKDNEVVDKDFMQKLLVTQ